MADLAIGDLENVQSCTDEDLFLTEQNGVAYNVTFHQFIQGLIGTFEGHGGIASITTRNGSGTSGNGLYHIITITMEDNTTAEFSIRDGLKGSTGATGAAATLRSREVKYAEYSSGSTIPPSSAWLDNIPASIDPGNYLWTRTTLTFNTGSPVVYYSVARQGVDGSGTPSSNSPLSDDLNGDGIAGTATSYSRSDHRHPAQLYYVTGTVDANNLVITNSKIKSNMRLVKILFGTPANVKSPVSWSTASKQLSLSGTTFVGTTNVYAYLAVTQ